MRPIVFLHLPKTAGQSIRILLGESFPKRLMFPGQLDSHLALYSISDLKQFTIFSGHFSWSLLDFLGDNALFFTVLREPALRLISFYLHLRRDAEGMSKDQLILPHNQGIRAALDNPFEIFLSTSDAGLRQFVLSYFDNYYMYYFATRMVNGRGLVRDAYPESDHFTTERVMQVAIRNARERVRVFTIQGLNELVQSLSGEDGFIEAPLPWVNKHSEGPTSTVAEVLPRIAGNLSAAEEQLYLRTQFDEKFYRMLV